MKRTLINSKPVIGKKKTSTAKCNFYSSEALSIVVNNEVVSEHFLTFITDRIQILKSLSYLVKVWVNGGGFSSQRIVVLKSIARSLANMFPETKSVLKRDPLLWFDNRKVERKKFGLRKARKAQQWVKR